MMKRQARILSQVVTIIMVLAISAMQVVPVLADDEAPPPPPATEVVDSAAGGVVPTLEENPIPEAPPADVPVDAPATDAAVVSPAATEVSADIVPAVTEGIPANSEPAPASTEEVPPVTDAVPAAVDEPAAEPETPAEILAQVAEGTDVVVLDENGEPVSLATQEASEILSTGDPQWCPVGVAPNSPTCSGPKDSFNGGNAITDLIQWLTDHPQSVAGVIWIKGSFAGGYTGNLATEGGAITLNGTTLTSMSNYALTIKGGWTGTGTAINSGTPTIFNVPLSIINWKGNVTLSDIEIAIASGTNALNITTTKDISLTRVNSHHNTGYGARLNNTSGTGKVTITDSHFDSNGGAYGIYAISNGAITLTNVTASQNTAASYGASLSNSSSTGTPGITLTGCTFNNNFASGLYAFSKGAILGSNLTTSGNGVLSSSGMGAYLANTAGIAGVTLTGTNIFNDNYGTGLNINSKGAITLSNVIANANDGNGYGANLNNSTSSTPQPITLTGSNQFKYNYTAGLNIVSKGMVTLNNVNASGSLHNSGLYVDTCVWDVGLAACTGSPLGGTKLTGTNTFNDNYVFGLYLYTVGTLTLNNITANNNGVAGSYGDGAHLDASYAAAGKAVTLTGTNVFNGNYNNGLSITSKGNITINNLTASNTIHGAGANIDNNAAGAVGNVTLTGTNLFNGNYSNGLSVDSLGAITLSSITASGNGTGGSGHGAYLDNGGATGKPITLSGTNQFNTNHNNGLSINSTGAVKLNNITANGNLVSDGMDVYTTYNHASLAAVTLSGTNTFNDNHATGLYIFTSGIITLSNLNAARNVNGTGAYIDNSGALLTAPRNISLTGSSTFTDNYNFGLQIISYGTISASNITATGNGASGLFGEGLYISNSSGTLARNVTLTGTNVFNSNYGYGLDINSRGAITISNLRVNDNGSMAGSGTGAYLMNNYAGAGNVTLSGINTFNGNYSDGLFVDTHGAITINSLTASGNGHAAGDHGADLNNTSGTNAAITLTGAVIVNGNYDSGLDARSTGSITAGSITATGNLNGNGVVLRNDYGASTANITLKGVNIFSDNHSNGLEVQSFGLINLLTTRITANGNAAGYGVIAINDGASTSKLVKLTGTNVFNGNYYGGLYMISKGAITTSNLTANNSIHGTGISLTNNASGSVGVVTLAGYNTFLGNYNSGLGISSLGTVTASNLTASGNGILGTGGYGVYIDNTGAATPQAVTMTGTNIFNGNYYDGLYLVSKGTITTNNLTASNSVNGTGVTLANNVAGATSTILVNGTNVFNGNHGTGIYVQSLGAITLNNLTASNNGSFGAVAGNDAAATPQAVKLNGTNTFNGNFTGGLLVDSRGAVTINNLTASYTVNGWGAEIMNHYAGAVGGVTLTGFVNANENFSSGLYIESRGNVSITKITADGNGGDGLYTNTTGNITLTCGSFTANADNGVQLTAPLATLTGVSAAGNTAANFNTGSTPLMVVRSCPLP